jgi:hypothetical protein
MGFKIANSNLKMEDGKIHRKDAKSAKDGGKLAAKIGCVV